MIIPAILAASFTRFEMRSENERRQAAEQREARNNRPPENPVPITPVAQPLPPKYETDNNEGPVDLNAEDYQLASSELKTIVDTQDPNHALQRISDMMDSDPKILRSCHGLVHAIGHWSFKKYGSFQAAMAYQDDVCGNGYMHGVIEEDFVNVSDIVKTMTTLCSPGAWSCFHAIGHGLMYYKQNDLYAALPLCNNLKGQAAAYCSEGVYMENFETNSLVHKAKYLKPEDPFYPCQDPALGYKDSCYYYSGRYLVRVHKDDYIGALKHCLKAPDASFSTTCARGVGAVTVRQNLKDPKAVEFICSQGPVSLVNSCIYGAMSYYSVNYQSAELTRKNFCGQFNNKYYADICASFTNPVKSD